MGLPHDFSIRRELGRNILCYAVQVPLGHERKGRGIVQAQYGPHVSSKVDAIVLVAGCRLLTEQRGNTVLADVAIAYGLCFI